MQTVVLISCVSKKLNYPAPAREFYVSPWFKKALAFALVRHTPVFILSAKYGLVELEQVIEPYELTLTSMTATERRIWAEQVHGQLRVALPGRRRYVILAGMRYREFLMPRLLQDGHEVDVPLQGLGIGYQLAWLGKRGPV